VAKDTIRKRLFLSPKEISAVRTNLTDSHLKQAKMIIKKIQVGIESTTDHCIAGKGISP
jgi:hypothetical protein